MQRGLMFSWLVIVYMKNKTDTRNAELNEEGKQKNVCLLTSRSEIYPGFLRKMVGKIKFSLFLLSPLVYTAIGDK